MIKVVTYGTFDLLHEGHINLLKRAKALGDYLLVGVTTENFDITRGKVNVQQSLMERMEAVKRTGIADEVFPEEYLGQKIDDIKRYGVSVFAIGSDWMGKFDYLKEFCEVVYLPRTEGISSSELRSKNFLKIGAYGGEPGVAKIKRQSEYVNGVEMDSFFFGEDDLNIARAFGHVCSNYDELLNRSDAVFISCRPEERYARAKQALLAGKHVMIESPVSLKKVEAGDLFSLAKERGLVLFESIKTAYSLAFSRLILLVKGGLIGEVKSVEVTCTSLEITPWLLKSKYYGSFTGWGGIALLPIFKILGLDYIDVAIQSLSSEEMSDIFTKVNFVYRGALASARVGIGVKSEGCLCISGTKGYIYVPAPWWKSDYFEVRYENAAHNKRYFYENEGEGLRTELVHFLRCIRYGESNYYIDQSETEAICELMEKHGEENLQKLKKERR